jgi:nucleoside-diphosphate-sugar epimerase
MRVLVIGGAGYIGQRLVGQLRDAKVEAISADLRGSGAVDATADIRLASDVYQLMARARPDAIVITAYMLTTPTSRNPLGAVETNILGLTNVFQAAADLGVRRVIFTAAGAIYGSRLDYPNAAVDENTECRPRTTYARMKRFNEWMAEQYNQAGSTQIVSFRVSGPHGAFGAHGSSSNTGGASAGGSSPYDLVLGATGRQDSLTLPWASDSVFRFIHVEDAAAAYLPLLLAETLEHRVYNAPGFAVSMTDLAEAASTECRLNITFEVPGRSIDHIARIDSSRYEQEFPFRPRALADCLRDELASRALVAV